LDLDPSGKVKIKMQFRERSSGEKGNATQVIYTLCGSGFHVKGGGYLVDMPK